MTDLYMHVHTGTIQAKEEWLEDICGEELELTGHDTQEECFESYVDKKLFIAVDEEGNEI